VLLYDDQASNDGAEKLDEELVQGPYMPKGNWLQGRPVRVKL